MDPGQEAETTELLQFLYACPVGLMEFSRDGDIALINPLAMQLLMPLSPEGFAVNFYSLMESFAPELRNMVDNFSPNQGTICDNQHILVRPGSKQTGTEARVLSCTIVRLAANRFIASLADVSKQVAQAKRLSQAETWLASLLDGINDFATLSVDEHGIIIGADGSMFRQSGFAASETIGLELESFTAHSEGFETISVVDQIAIAKQQGWYLSEGWQRKKGGEAYWSQRLISVRNDADPADLRPAAYTALIRDVTRHKSDTGKLLHMLRKDYLTGAWNRAHFFEAGEAECIRAERYGQPLAMIAIDIDHFKKVNDTYGHAVGDDVLMAFSQICTNLLRPNDMIARVGGEEFAILLPSTDAEGAANIAKRIRSALAAMRLHAGDHTITVTASFGCMQMHPQASSLAEMLAVADTLLYKAKHAGRNRVEADLTLEAA